MAVTSLLPALSTAVAVLLLGACGTDAAPIVDQDATDPETSATAPSPSAPADPSPSAPSTAGTGSMVAAPVYFAGTTGTRRQGLGLFREFHRVPADRPAEAALALLASGDASDPDYRTLLPGGEVVEVRTDAGITVVVPDDSPWLDRGTLTEEEATLAVQSVVYTVQGVLQSKQPVRIETESGPAETVLGLDASAGFERAPELDVLGLVNVTAPEEGAVVPDTFQASGVASSFEGTVLIEVRDDAGSVVHEDFVTAEGWMDRLHPWSASVDVSALPPGTYTFAARTDDPSGGAEGFGPTEDTKTITVQ